MQPRPTGANEGIIGDINFLVDRNLIQTDAYDNIPKPNHPNEYIFDDPEQSQVILDLKKHVWPDNPMTEEYIPREGRSVVVIEGVDFSIRGLRIISIAGRLFRS